MEDYQCACVPQTDVCRKANEDNRAHYLKKRVLSQTQEKERVLFEEAKFMLESAEQELKGLLYWGWITKQPGPDAMCLVFATEEEWRQKIQDVQDLVSVLKAEKHQHGLRYQIAGRSLSILSKSGPPGPHGLNP